MLHPIPRRAARFHLRQIHARFAAVAFVLLLARNPRALLLTSPPHNYSFYFVHPARSLAARNNRPARSHPIGSRRSTLPAPPATACSRPARASCSTDRRPPGCHKSNNGAAALSSQPRGTTPVETGIAKCAPENNACTAHSRARDILRRDRNLLRYAPSEERLPGICEP